MDSVSSAQPAATQFAALLRSLRIAAELTQEELSERSGVSVRAISDLERGAKTRPQRATVDLLAQGLGLDAAQRAALEASVPSRHRPAERADRSFDLPVGGFVGAVPDGPLVARASEVAQVRDIVDAVSRGSGRMLLLNGEPGVGKTRLAQEITVICRARGMYLAAGQCYEHHQAMAFYPFLDMLRRIVRAAHGSLSIDPLQVWPDLRLLIPDSGQAPVPGSMSLGGERDQQRLFWAVSDLIGALAAVTPVVIALDDLQWADQTSLTLVHHLALQLRDAPVLVLGAYRDSDVARRLPLRRILLDLHREHLSEQLTLRRFDLEGTAAIVAAMLHANDISPELVARVQAHTDGNPFFVEEVVRGLIERGEAIQEDGSWTFQGIDEISIPRNVFEAVSERLSRLSPGTQKVLVEASVLGDTFEFDDLLAMSERSEAEVEASLEEAQQASLIEFGDGDHYHFHHGLIQQVLYRGAQPRRRKRLHLAAGHAIEQQPDRLRQQRAAELAGHFRRAGDGEKALHYAIIAGDHAESRFAHREAERHFRDSLELARESGENRVEAEILEKLGRVLTNFGDYDHARQSLERAVTLYRRSSDRRGEVRVTVQLGSVYRAMGRSGDAIALMNDLLSRIQSDGKPEDVVELHIVLETLYYSTGLYREGLQAAERAVGLARASGNIPALCRALTGYGTELMILGRLDEGLASLEEAVALPEADDDPFNLVRALGNVSEGYRSRGNLIRSRELVERSMAVAERIQSPWDTAIALAGMGAIYRALGEWQQARDYLERGVDLQRGLKSAWWSVFVSIELGGLCVDVGELDRADRLLQGALSVARRAGHLEGVRNLERLLAELDLLQGNPLQARSRLEPLLDRPGIEELQVTELMPTLATACELGGDFSKAEAIIEEAIARARRVNGLWALAHALVVRGWLLSCREQWNDANRDLNEALRLARSMPCPYLEARALYELGMVHRREGGAQEAKASLIEALAIFRRLGAKPYIERCQEALASKSASR